MKKTLIALAMLVAIPTAMAGFGPNFDGARPGGMHGPNVERMATVLDLTPEQQEKVKTLLEEQAKKRQETRTAMQTEMQTKMQSILTKEQYEKMADMRQHRAGRFAGRDGAGQGMGSGYGRRGNCDGMGPRDTK